MVGKMTLETYNEGTSSSPKEEKGSALYSWPRKVKVLHAWSGRRARTSSPGQARRRRFLW